MPYNPSTESLSSEWNDASLARRFGPGEEVAGRYVVESVLGTGGSSVVYAALDRQLGTRIALKILRQDRVGPAALKRFRREVAIAREAQSSRLVRVFDIGRTEELVYLTMELVEGESLRSRLERGSLSVPEAMTLSLQVLEGLQVLHAMGVVHRDIKPGNILMDRDGNAKLADYGLARNREVDESRPTATDAVIGTLEYLSPEQALGKPVSARSDLYSFGLVLYEMLTGRAPYRGESRLGTLLQQIQRRAPDLRTANPEIPRWVARVVSKLLEKEPSARYADCNSVLTDLRSRRGPRWIRRRIRFSTAAAGGLAVLLVAAAIVRSTRPTHHFADLLWDPQSGARAVGIAGETLWKFPGVLSVRNSAVVRLPTGLQVAVAPAERNASKTDRRLLFLDADSGRLIRQVVLPGAADKFPGFSDAFDVKVNALDLDGDGVDEILATYIHSIYWPSYTVLYEPKLDRSRLIFVGSGHHHFLAAADLDGDGRKDLLIGGPNNQMGWFGALAAIRVIPPVGSTLPLKEDWASSQDRAGSSQQGGSLVWYALTPNWSDSDRLKIDPVNRRITVDFGTGRAFVLGFDGLEPVTGSKGVEERRNARALAYSALRSAVAKLNASVPSAGLPDADQAIAEARRADDRVLAEWSERVRAKLLVGARRTDEADSVFQGLWKESETSQNVAFEAARLFHIGGDLQRALAWYRRCFATRGPESSRPQYEFLEGLVLALCELGRFDEALAEVERFTASNSEKELASAYRSYVLWRQGILPSRDGLLSALGGASPDLVRYWLLEFRLAGGDPVPALLLEVERELGRTSGSPALLLSLKGEILRRLGRFEEAEQFARDAFKRASMGREREIELRAHHDLIARRYYRAARAAGHAEDAKAALVGFASRNPKAAAFEDRFR